MLTKTSHQTANEIPEQGDRRDAGPAGQAARQSLLFTALIHPRLLANLSTALLACRDVIQANDVQRINADRVAIQFDHDHDAWSKEDEITMRDWILASAGSHYREGSKISFVNSIPNRLDVHAHRIPAISALSSASKSHLA